MPADHSMKATRAWATGAVCIVLALTSGCVTDVHVDAVEPTSRSENERPTPTPTVTETADAPDPGLRGVSLGVDCATLLSADTLYEFNPNVGVDPSHVPSARGTEAIAYRGVSCGWVNQTSGDTLSLALARFEGASSDALRTTAAARDGATAVGGEGDSWVRRVNGVGALEIITAEYWIVIESRMIVEASDAEVLIDAVFSALP